jgi:Cys-rich repeat protein
MCSNIDINWNLLGGNSPVDCTVNSDCPSSYTCKWKFCSATKMQLCATDSDCPSGETCSGYIDGSGTSGYPCRMQPGFTTNMASSPVYEWNNTFTGSANLTGHDVDFKPNGAQLQANRDFFNDTVKSRYKPYVNPHPMAVAAYKPGDANEDGKVDGADLALWQQNYDPNGSPSVLGSAPSTVTVEAATTTDSPGGAGDVFVSEAKLTAPISTAEEATTYAPAGIEQAPLSDETAPLQVNPPLEMASMGSVRTDARVSPDAIVDSADEWIGGGDASADEVTSGWIRRRTVTTATNEPGSEPADALALASLEVPLGTL